jgi:hypothetical protein
MKTEVGRICSNRCPITYACPLTLVCLLFLVPNALSRFLNLGCESVVRHSLTYGSEKTDACPLIDFVGREVQEKVLAGEELFAGRI